MGTTVSHAIKVTARSRYEAALSDPVAGRYLFSYRITIANNGRDTVQLERRKWLIKDSLAASMEVEGPGVVGETPVLRPGEEFSYTSACDLRSGFGRMLGTYRMRRLSDGHPFEVGIPAMDLIVPYVAN